uniref:hypothetical protein n=1 Tax=Serratia quinivorans TaxID=137545 RepID=UPI0035C6AFE6
AYSLSSTSLTKGIKRSGRVEADGGITFDQFFVKPASHISQTFVSCSVNHSAVPSVSRSRLYARYGSTISHRTKRTIP